MLALPGAAALGVTAVHCPICYLFAESSVWSSSPRQAYFEATLLWVNGCAGISQELDRWEERLEELFEGRPYDEYDAALTETISRFPVDIQPFRDMARSAHCQQMS